jgi:hypothetical protein
MWTAAEAKRAAQLWWEWMDIDNYTLMNKKQLLATLSYKPMNTAIRAVANENEKRLERVLRAAGIKEVKQLGDNEPFDVWIGADPIRWYSGASKAKPRHVIEVKTIVRAKNDKITMHGPSKARKEAELKKFGKKTFEHTVVFDERTGKIYYRQDLGSFRLGAMQEVTESDLQRVFGGKVREVQTGHVGQLLASRRAQQAAEELVMEFSEETVDMWKWERMPVTNKTDDLLRAAARFEEFFEGKYQNLVMEFSDITTLSPAQRIQLINDVAEEICRMQNTFPGLATRWDFKHGMSLNNIMFHKGDTLFNLTIDDVKIYDWIGQADGGSNTLGFYWPNFTHPLGTLDLPTEDLLVSHVDTAVDLIQSKVGRKVNVKGLKRGKLIVGSGAFKTVDDHQGLALNTFVHEIGHSVQESVNRDIFYRRTYAKRWTEIFNKTPKDELARTVGHYAATNEAELFAESFAAYVHPDYGTVNAITGRVLKLPKKIEEFFDDLLITQESL